jgi:hypothetical protein
MSFFNSSIHAITTAFGGGGNASSVHDMMNQLEQGKHIPPPPAKEGYEWDGNHWKRASGHPPVDVSDSAGPEGAQAPWVESHDHSHSDPSTWSVKEWKEAFKRDPEKYLRLFAELSTEGEGALSQDVKDHQLAMDALVSNTTQELNRRVTLLKSIADANHETLKTLAQIRV